MHPRLLFDEAGEPLKLPAVFRLESPCILGFEASLKLVVSQLFVSLTRQDARLSTHCQVLIRRRSHLAPLFLLRLRQLTLAGIDRTSILRGIGSETVHILNLGTAHLCLLLTVEPTSDFSRLKVCQTFSFLQFLLLRCCFYCADLVLWPHILVVSTRQEGSWITGVEFLFDGLRVDSWGTLLGVALAVGFVSHVLIFSASHKSFSVHDLLYLLSLRSLYSLCSHLRILLYWAKVVYTSVRLFLLHGLAKKLGQVDPVVRPGAFAHLPHNAGQQARLYLSLRLFSPLYSFVLLFSSHWDLSLERIKVFSGLFLFLGLGRLELDFEIVSRLEQFALGQ